MKIQWTEQADSDLVGILDFIARDRPGAAEHVLQRITASAHRLRQFPAMGKTGRRLGTRELVVAGLPFLIVYTVRAERVVVVSVLHTSREFPAN